MVRKAKFLITIVQDDDQTKNVGLVITPGKVCLIRFLVSKYEAMWLIITQVRFLIM